MGWHWLKNLGKASEDVATPIADRPQGNTVILQASNTTSDLHEEIWLALQEQQEEMKLAQMKLQYIQQIQHQGFQVQRSRLNHKRAQELQDFIQNVQLVIKEGTHDLLLWRVEQEKQLQEELERRRIKLQQDWQPISRKLT
ncbi:MAG TPA: hypothetical protein V6D12_07550 [Candidatus Obscuribacterales bacterium]